MNDTLECYICLDPISNDINANTYILECCKNSVHLDCLQKWYNSNHTNPNCFICNQHNNFCADLVTPITDNSCILVPINAINIVQIQNSSHQTTRERVVDIVNIVKVVSIVCGIMSIVIIICIIFF
jgi:hypothetical protein